MERLLERCAADRLADEEHATLERHLAGCPDCAAELEAMKTFAAVVAEAEGDAGLDRAAIAGAMARLGAKPTLAP
ncbi:MAG TPA: hypothetical protein VHU40_08955, partial [Polyangia bacterium]|nr:hypothetical protein [Polyangia bacterium]